MIYTVMFGYPTSDDTKFDNETACQIYLHTQYGDEVVQFQADVFAQVVLD
jgi:hypothetical protein